MATESVILTALPNGLHASGRLKVTVFVSPRLSTDGPASLPLASFPSFVNWPGTFGRLMSEGRLAVEVDGTGPVDTVPDPDSPPPDTATWKLLFDAPNVAVHTGAFKDLSDRRVLTFPTADVADQVLDLYRDIASNSPSSFPPATTGRLAALGRILGTIGFNPQEINRRLDGLIAEEGQEGKKGRFLNREALSQAEQRQLAFAQAHRFYNRPNTRDPLGKERAPDRPKEPDIDFHGYVAFLGDYPLLLRPLGLAVDLLAKRPAGFAARGRVRIHIEPPGDLAFAAADAARPWTRYERQAQRFLPQPREREGDLADGTLRLENSKVFRVHQIDVDGTALKTLDFAANVGRLAAHLSSGERSMTDDEASLPALRTGGFVVTRDDRARQLVGQIDASAGHEADHTAGTATELFAEDVTRGFRPDVLDGAGRWLTLCARDGTYVVERNASSTPVPVEPDQGFVKGSSTTSVPGEADADLYLHESVFGWDGWSLVAKRPGQAIVDSAGHNVGRPPSTPPADFPLVTQFVPTPGTLPRLRFGQTYRFRVRAVDLAGNSVPEADLVAQHVSPPAAFQRFDPVPSPAVVPRRRFTEGESLMRMVIRSTLGFLPDAYVAQGRITGLTGHTDPLTAYLALNERHLAAPKSPVQLAEWHSMLDAGIGEHAPQPAVDAQFDVAAREAGSFLDPGPDAAVVNPNPGAVPTDLATLPKGGALASGEYVVRDTDDLALPYLPDPLSAGASFTTLPGDAATRTQAWPGGAWPDRRPIRIRIVDGGETGAAQKAPSWESGPRLLTVFLRQAELVTVRLSSFPAGGLDVLGVWNLEPAATQAAQLSMAKAGRHWMLTPYQDLTIVHAVEKPLAAPVVSVDDAGVRRNEGETFAVLEGRVDNHAKSTGRLDLEAIWTEPVDDLAKDAPQDADNLGEIPGQAHVADFLLEATEDGCRIARDDAPASGSVPPVHKVRHEFRDTKHRRVTYRAVATTRFREYFPPQITNDPNLITHVGADTRLSVPSSRRPDPPDVLYVVPTFRWVDEVFRGLPAGIPVEALQPKVARAVSGLTGRAAALVERGVREEAVDLGPGIRLPRVTRRVRKAGLRVYLGRPWYSSGAEELLAVVVPDQPYFVWPIDLGRGLTVDAIARTVADTAADRLLTRGVLKPAGGARLSASERLVASVQKLKPAAGQEADTVEEAGALFTSFQVSQLTSALAGAGLLLRSGDPEQFVTRWGSDPIWGSDAPASGPWIHQFPLRSQVGTGLSLAEAAGNTVAAIGHLPRYDQGRRLWYCDIDIDAGTSYFPFVRMGLARYQPSSIPGVHLSRVVVPEWAQILPDRTASIARPVTGRATVTLRGPAGFTDLAETVLGAPAAGGPEGMALSRFAVAQVERLPAGAVSDLAWTAAGDEIRLDLTIRKSYSDIQFSGTVPLPAKQPGEQLRVTLREYEILQTDLSQADDVVKHDTFTVEHIQPAEVGPPVTLVPHPDDRPVRFRLVYADHLTL